MSRYRDKETRPTFWHAYADGRGTDGAKGVRGNVAELPDGW